MMIKIKNQKILLALFSTFYFLLSVSIVFAAIVPCTDNCNLCYLFTGVKNIIDFLVQGIAFPLAVLMLIYGGVKILTSGGSEEGRKKGKEAIESALWGLVLTFGAWLIIDTLLKYLTGGGGIQNWGPWNNLPNC